MSGFVENEISSNAFGGTEIAKRTLGAAINPALLEPTQIICSRIRDLDPTKIRIFWAHDTAQDPESAQLKNASFREKFHHFVFISHWQYEQYRTVLGFPYKHNHSVIESGIVPAPIVEKPTDQIRLIYSSTPQRGLHLLLPVFEALAKQYPQLHLDVFSSFKIYGWDDYDAQFEHLYEFCRNHPQITYHPFSPDRTIIQTAQNNAHIFAYPCIWPETSCRAMLEAMSARALCVHPNFAALPDTSGGLNLMYQGDEDQQLHVHAFYGALEQAIKRIEGRSAGLINHLNAVKGYVDQRFSMANVTLQWEGLLTQLAEMYPTAESRAMPEVPEPVFNYSIKA